MGSALPSYGYDYRPRKRHILLAFFVVLSVVAIADFVVLRAMRPFPSLQDEYRPLNGAHEELVGYYASNRNLNPFKIPSPDERAVVTALFSESYTPAVLTLGHSLQSVQTSARRMLLYIPERISPKTICRLQAARWELLPVERIAPPDGGHGMFHRFLDNYSKLHIWTLDKLGIKSVVFLDGDMLVRRNFDEIWALPFEFAAVPDVYGGKRGFATSFNAGMMYLRTSSTIFADLISKIHADGYRHGEAEQSLLNMYFAPQMALLPYIYNANLMIKERNLVLWQAFENSTRIVHYTLLKPFVEEERQQARDRIFEPEMRIWDLAWEDTLAEGFQEKC